MIKPKFVAGLFCASLLAFPAYAQTPFDKDLPGNGGTVYKKTCSFCHDEGTVGAPKFGDKTAWAPRIAKGREALYDSVLNGLQHMTARRGRRGYTDEDFKHAVDYLLENSQ